MYTRSYNHAWWSSLSVLFPYVFSNRGMVWLLPWLSHIQQKTRSSLSSMEEVTLTMMWLHLDFPSWQDREDILIVCVLVEEWSVYTCSTKSMRGEREVTSVGCLVDRTGGLSLPVSNRMACIYILGNKGKHNERDEWYPNDIILRGSETRDEKKRCREGGWREKMTRERDIRQGLDIL